MVPVKEAGKDNDDAGDGLAVSDEGDNEINEAVEGYLCIVPVFDRRNTVVLKESVSVACGWGGGSF